jgi:hypothetical protein
VYLKTGTLYVRKRFPFLKIIKSILKSLLYQKDFVYLHQNSNIKHQISIMSIKELWEELKRLSGEQITAFYKHFGELSKEFKNFREYIYKVTNRQRLRRRGLVPRLRNQGISSRVISLSERRQPDGIRQTPELRYR